MTTRFGVTLRLPQTIEKEGYEAIHFLKQSMENGTIELDNLPFVITNPAQNPDLLQQFPDGKGFFRFQHREVTSRLFGTSVNMGPMVMEMEAEISNLAATQQRFAKAKAGGGVRIVLKPLSPVRLSLGMPKGDQVAPL